MANKRGGLGRDLGVLLSSSKRQVQVNETPVTEQQGGYSLIAIDTSQPGRFQPRKDMNPEALEELAASIRAQGLLQPIVVRPIKDQQKPYEIVAGERRWRAAKLAGLTKIPAITKEIPDEATVAMALIENIQREDLNPMEEATALHRLLEEFALTHQQVADAVGKSRTTITNLLRLLSLEIEVRTYLENGDLEMGHARALLSLESSDQVEAARTVVNKSLTVRETENLVKRLQAPAMATHHQPARDPDVERLQKSLSNKLGAKVSLQHNVKGKGKIIIKYNNLEELENILTHME